MKVGTLEIELLANMARLQSDMDKARRAVSDTVAKMNKVLGAIGVGVSLAGIASMVKSVVNVGDHLNDLRKITGLTVNELGGLDKQAKLNGTNLDAVARAVGIMSKKMYAGADAFRVLGISIRGSDGNLRNTNQVLLDVADQFSRMQDGAQKSAIANQIFGKSGRDLIPLLNDGRQSLIDAVEAHQKYSGWTNQSAEQADKFNDQLIILEGRVTGVKTRLVTDLLPALIDISSGFFNATENVNKFSFSTNILVPVLKGLAIAGYTIFDTFNGVARSLGAAVAQMVALGQFDFEKVMMIENELNRLNRESRKSYDEFIKSVLNGDKATEAAAASAGKLTKTNVKLGLSEGELKKSKENLSKAQSAALKIEHAYIKLLEIERKQREDLIKPYAKSGKIASDKLKSINDEITALKLVKDKQIDLQQAVQLTTIARLEEKKAGLKDPEIIKQINDEIDARKQIEQLIPIQKKLENETRSTTDTVSQLWIQAGRNIQSSLGDLVFDFFNGGLNDMVRNAGNAVLRIMSEFAGLKIAQSIGLAGMFSGAGGVTVKAKPKGLGTLTALSAGTLGVDLLSMFIKGGFGSMGLMSGIGGMLPGSAGAFFGGMGGGTVAGVSSTASLMGSSFAAVAGPAVALFAVDAIGRMLAGDKKLGGAEHIPVIGGFLAAMFGRGPMKFRQQVAIGEATSEGFDGRVTDVFRAKGGLFVGNKHREQAAANETELLDLFNTTIRGYADASRGFATNLGLDVEIINGYHKTIRLESEKKKTLTEEAIRDMLTGVGNEMADSLVPAISTLKKTGEDSMATLSRLNSEFLGLTQGAENLGASTGYAKDLIMGMSFEARTAFVEAAGGLEALAAKTQFFSQNFLTDAERLAPVQERLNAALVEMGLSTSLTRDEFKNLVQTNDGLRLKLLELAPAYVLVTDAMQASADAADALAKSTAADALAKKQITNNTQRGLEIELMGLQGKTQEALTASRIDELMAMDSSLITLKQAIFRQQDFNTAAEKANAQRLADIDTAKENLNTVFGDIDLAFSALGRAVEADKDKILQSNAEIELKRESATTNYNNALDAQNKTISQFVDSINDLQGFSSSLKSTIESINPMGMEAARSQIESAIKTGNLNTENVSRAIGILSKTESSGFTSALEFKRAQAKNVQLLNDLSISTDAQLTLEQRTLSALEVARDRLTDSFKIEMALLDDQLKSNAAELSRLDRIITDAKTQIDVLRGIDVSIISVAAALGNLKTQSAAVGGAQAAVAAAQSVPVVVPQSVVSQIIVPQIVAPQIVAAPARLDITAAANAPFQGPLPGLSAERQAWLNRNIAKFDIGGTVPKTGIAMIHKNEQVLSVDDKDNIGKQISELKTAVEVLTVSANKTKRIFEKWEGVGMPATRTA